MFLFRLIAKFSSLKNLDRKEGEWGGLSYTESSQALGYTLWFSIFSLKLNIFPFSASILTFSTQNHLILTYFTHFDTTPFFYCQLGSHIYVHLWPTKHYVRWTGKKPRRHHKETVLSTCIYLHFITIIYENKFTMHLYCSSNCQCSQNFTLPSHPPSFVLYFGRWNR